MLNQPNQGEQTENYVLSTEENLEIRDLSVPKENKFLIEVQSNQNHYQFQCMNFTEKDSWKRALENMLQNPVSDTPRRPDNLLSQRKNSGIDAGNNAEQLVDKEGEKINVQMRARVNVTLMAARGLSRQGNAQPYCRLVIGNKVHKSSAAAKGVAEPSWNESFTLYVCQCAWTPQASFVHLISSL